MRETRYGGLRRHQRVDAVCLGCLPHTRGQTAEADGVDPLVAAQAAYLVSRMEDDRGDAEAAARRRAALGLVSQFLVVGPFGEGRSTLTQVFPPERDTARPDDLGEAGGMALAVGVAGSGKTVTVVAILVDAWHGEGKKVVAMTVPWRATGPLRDAGVDDALAVEASSSGLRRGRYTIDENTVIVADEVSMIGVPQQLALLRVAREHGARIVEIGDPRQCGAVETPAIDLMAKAIGDEQIPKLLTSIRQQTQRGREIAGMFRAGRAEEGIAAMRQDGDVALVAGGPDAVIRRTVASWRRRVDANAADPSYSLIVMAPTNERVMDIGKAVRAERRRAGEIGEEDVIVRAKSGPTADQVIDLPLAVGDKVRPFHRLYDADTPGRSKYWQPMAIWWRSASSAGRHADPQRGRGGRAGHLVAAKTMARTQERARNTDLWLCVFD